MSNFNYQSLFIAFLFISALIINSDPAYAQTALFDSGTNFLTALQDLLTNTWARIIGIIAICACGILWMLGRIQWMAFASVTFGLILVFGAPAIVDSVQGSL